MREERQHIAPRSCKSTTIDAAGLPGRRFPFRARTDAEQGVVNDAVDAVIGWAYGRVSRIAKSRCRSCGLTTADAEDLAQLVVQDLWRRALPAFDVERDTPLSAYLTRCIQNSVAKRIRGMVRVRRITTTCADALEHRAGMFDPVTDDRIEQLAGAIMSDPAAYLDRDDAAVLRAALDGQADSGATIARGLRMPVGTYHNRMTAIRRRLAGLAREFIPLPAV